MGTGSEKWKSARLPRAGAVIVAGGSGVRFGGDKLTADLGGMPVLARTLLAFQRTQAVGEIVLVARQDAAEEMTALCRRWDITKLTAVVPGGSTRTQSCHAGVMAVSPRAELIAIHDGARPLVTEKIILDALWAAWRHTAAAPAVPVRDTVRQAKDGAVTATPDRKTLYAMQTPQCFQADLIRAALTAAVEQGLSLTDDCAAVERIGGVIHLSPGSEENLKITTRQDLKLAELILAERSGT